MKSTITNPVKNISHNGKKNIEITDLMVGVVGPDHSEYERFVLYITREDGLRVKAGFTRADAQKIVTLFEQRLNRVAETQEVFLRDEMEGA